MANYTKKSFLDLDGLTRFWEKVQQYVDAKSSGLTDTINGLTLNYVSNEKKIACTSFAYNKMFLFERPINPLITLIPFLSDSKTRHPWFP